MALWTDLIDPVEATGIARAEAELIEQSKGGTLARFLPNQYVDGDTVKFRLGSYGLVDDAKYRAFNAPPEIGKGAGISTAIVELPAISREEPIDERTQKDLARLSDDQVRKSITAAIRRSVQAISNRQERSRGVLISTGTLTVDQDNFLIGDNYGRDAALTFTASALWSVLATDRISQLNTWSALYATYNNGQAPGRIVMGRAELNTLVAGTQFAHQLANGATRPGLSDEVAAYLASAGLPPIEVYDRSTSVAGTTTRVLPAGKVYFLPEPTDPNDEEGSLLGATYWGRTVSSGFPGWGIEPSEQPGIVAGIYREEKVGSSVLVQADSIGLPTLWNANASMTVTVV
jgi:Phage major capsid protein E